MLNIRNGIFETNSSSVHTLCITKSNNLNVPSEFNFPFAGQFGWQTDWYPDSYNKAAYFYQILKDIVLDESKERFMLSDEYLNNKDEKYKENTYWYWYPEKYSEYKKCVDEVENEYRQQVESILNDYGCYNVTWEDEQEDSYIYIDHIDEAHGFFNDMINNPELLIHFLFGNSRIYTGNDNDDYDWPDRDKNSDYEYQKGN